MKALFFQSPPSSRQGFLDYSSYFVPGRRCRASYSRQSQWQPAHFVHPAGGTVPPEIRPLRGPACPPCFSLLLPAARSYPAQTTTAGKAHIAQRKEHPISNRDVAGSIPAVGSRHRSPTAEAASLRLTQCEFESRRWQSRNHAIHVARCVGENTGHFEIRNGSAVFGHDRRCTGKAV